MARARVGGAGLTLDGRVADRVGDLALNRATVVPVRATRGQAGVGASNHALRTQNRTRLIELLVLL